MIHNKHTITVHSLHIHVMALGMYGNYVLLHMYYCGIHDNSNVDPDKSCVNIQWDLVTQTTVPVPIVQFLTVQVPIVQFP